MSIVYRQIFIVANGSTLEPLQAILVLDQAANLSTGAAITVVGNCRVVALISNSALRLVNSVSYFGKTLRGHGEGETAGSSLLRCFW